MYEQSSADMFYQDPPAMPSSAQAQISYFFARVWVSVCECVCVCVCVCVGLLTDFPLTFTEFSRIFTVIYYNIFIIFFWRTPSDMSRTFHGLPRWLLRILRVFFFLYVRTPVASPRRLWRNCGGRFVCLCLSVCHIYHIHIFFCITHHFGGCDETVAGVHMLY